MSNQIVQLIDNDNNNIYPVAGALKDGSVTTSTIDDGAVTADKIDYSTLWSNWQNLTAAKGTWSRLAYRTLGKYVYLYGYASDITFADGQITSLPSNITPPTEVHCFADGAGGRKGRILIGTDGSVAMGAFDTTTGSGYMTFNVGFFID